MQTHKPRFLLMYNVTETCRVSEFVQPCLRCVSHFFLQSVEVHLKAKILLLTLKAKLVLRVIINRINLL